MKYMIASDIHGSAVYCEKLINRFKEEKADGLILLGDILYHGPRNDLPDGYAPKKVIEYLNPLRDVLTCVRGNCDAEVDQMVLDFPIMAQYSQLLYMGHDIFLTHGHKYNIDSLPNVKAGTYLIYGHTHVPLNKEQDGVICLNPGSVSIPKSGSQRGYMTLETAGFTWKNLDGQVYDERKF